MKTINRIVVSGRPPTVEIDPSCSSAYVRFKSGVAVAKTLTEQKTGVVVAIDLDSENEVIGVELAGVREFSVSAIVKLMPHAARNVDFSRARFIPSVCAREAEGTLA